MIRKQICAKCPYAVYGWCTKLMCELIIVSEKPAVLWSCQFRSAYNFGARNMIACKMPIPKMSKAQKAIADELVKIICELYRIELKYVRCFVTKREYEMYYNSEWFVTRKQYSLLQDKAADVGLGYISYGSPFWKYAWHSI